jgi:hypothetical protein
VYGNPSSRDAANSSDDFDNFTIKKRASPAVVEKRVIRIEVSSRLTCIGASVVALTSDEYFPLGHGCSG